jgi:hypothetical protein
MYSFWTYYCISYFLLNFESNGQVLLILLFHLRYWIGSRNCIFNVIRGMRTEFWQESFLKGASCLLNKKQNDRGHPKCDGTRARTRFRRSGKLTSPFKSARASVQSTTGSRGVCISGCNAGYTMFRGSVKSTGYPLLSPVSPPLPLPCVTVCRHISTGV